ncbi:hypothetical protein L1887_42445 [Cichorium endivia]|nr:hypothetical protein L1887_42445 [Cichorium endivia]
MALALGHHPSQGSTEADHALLSAAGRYKRSGDKAEGLLVLDAMPDSLIRLVWPALVWLQPDCEKMGPCAYFFAVGDPFQPSRLRPARSVSRAQTLDPRRCHAHRQEQPGQAKRTARFRDIIASKSGGTVFLLHGAPGVGQDADRRGGGRDAGAAGVLRHDGRAGYGGGERRGAAGTGAGSVCCVASGGADRRGGRIPRRRASGGGGDILRNALSRVTIALRYDALDAGAREQVWRNLLGNLEDSDVDLGATGLWAACEARAEWPPDEEHDPAGACAGCRLAVASRPGPARSHASDDDDRPTGDGRRLFDVMHRSRSLILMSFWLVCQSSCASDGVVSNFKRGARVEGRNATQAGPNEHAPASFDIRLGRRLGSLKHPSRRRSNPSLRLLLGFLPDIATSHHCLGISPLFHHRLLLACSLARLLVLSLSSIDPILWPAMLSRRPARLAAGVARHAHRALSASTRSYRAAAHSVFQEQHSVLPNNLDASSDEFSANKAYMDGLVTKLDATHAKLALGGSEKARARHISRGKMLPRERVAALLDHGSPFVELSPMAAYNMYGNDDIPGAGMISGIGRVSGGPSA